MAAVPQGAKRPTCEPGQEILLKCHLFHEAFSKTPSPTKKFIYLSLCSDRLSFNQFTHIRLPQEAQAC